MSTKTKTAGFGLLEAIVALAVFAGAGVALFAWINANLARTAGLKERSEEPRAQALALAWAETLNPAQQAEGQTRLPDGTRLVWQSRLRTPRQRAAPLPGGTYSPFELALFELKLAVHLPGSDKPYRFSVERLGVWREPFVFEVP